MNEGFVKVEKKGLLTLIGRWQLQSVQGELLLSQRLHALDMFDPHEAIKKMLELGFLADTVREEKMRVRYASHPN
jgi:hypothetical protein